MSPIPLPRRTLLFATALTLFTIPVPGARAQAPETSRATVRHRPGRADLLHERAAALFETPRRYREAARLMREAAALRAATDSRGTAELLLAGRLSFYAQDWAGARRSLLTAARRSLANGQLATAADAYLDAAFAAISQRDRAAAGRFVKQAEQLLQSPHLQVAERERIQVRILPARLAADLSRH